MMRDYGICLKEGYSADEYASAWADDLYAQLYDSSIEMLWSNHLDAPEKYADELYVPDKLESELRDMCFDAYKEAYTRYEAELETLITDFEGNFHEYEVDDTVRDVVEGITGELFEQLEKLCERDGVELKE